MRADKEYSATHTCDTYTWSGWSTSQSKLKIQTYFRHILRVQCGSILSQMRVSFCREINDLLPMIKMLHAPAYIRHRSCRLCTRQNIDSRSCSLGSGWRTVRRLQPRTASLVVLRSTRFSCMYTRAQRLQYCCEFLRPCSVHAQCHREGRKGVGTARSPPVDASMHGSTGLCQHGSEQGGHRRANRCRYAYELL